MANDQVVYVAAGALPGLASGSSGHTEGTIERSTADGMTAASGGFARPIEIAAPAGGITSFAAMPASLPATPDAAEAPAGGAGPTSMPAALPAATADATLYTPNTTPVRTAASAHESPWHSVRLDDAWTSGTVAFLAAAIFSRRLIEGASVQVTARGIVPLDERDNRLTKLPREDE